MSAIAKTRSSSSISTSAYYNGDEKDTADSFVAKALISLSCSSSPSSSCSSDDDFPFRWGATRKRTNRFLLVKRVMKFYEFFQSSVGQNKALEALKVMFKSNKEILVGIESFQDLRWKKLDGDQMLEVVKEISRKRKIDVESENSAPVNMKKKKIEIVKSKKVSESVGEDDDLKESTKSYECSECKEVFSSFQALGGHTASHNRKKKSEEAIGIDNGLDSVAEEKKCVVYKCNLCPRNFPTGQALGGHKTSHNKERGIVAIEKEKATGSSSKQQRQVMFDFDLNVAPPVDLEDFESFSSSQFHSNLSLLC